MRCLDRSKEADARDLAQSQKHLKQLNEIDQSNTIPYKYLVSSETLSFFNSRRIDEEMVTPF
ncbi:protein of unknown function [Shewanella benthica]|uniref:Uncharacterized protein n=1 Tax=Shewanella benthica TaxID=43661 RepID=A0A330M2R5_9GAMM|nr:protein of unknown function [Shewanella benthica]